MNKRLLAVFLLCSALAWTQSTKVVRAGLHTDIKMTDPRKALDSFSLAVMSNVFEPLVAFEMTGTKIIPALATSWTADPSYRTWTYTLRPGVRFHDGSPVTPEAVVRSFAGVGGPSSGIGCAIIGQVAEGITLSPWCPVRYPWSSS